MLPRVQEVEWQLQEERGIVGENTSLGSVQFFVDYAQRRIEELHEESEKQTEPIAVAAAESPVPDNTEAKPFEDSPLDILPQDADDEDETPQQLVDVRNIKALNPMQRIVLGFIAANPGNEISFISYGLDIPANMVESHISALLDRGLIEHRDSKKDGGYHVK